MITVSPNCLRLDRLLLIFPMLKGISKRQSVDYQAHPTEPELASRLLGRLDCTTGFLTYPAAA